MIRMTPSAMPTFSAVSVSSMFFPLTVNNTCAACAPFSGAGFAKKVVTGHIRARRSTHHDAPARADGFAYTNPASTSHSLESVTLPVSSLVSLS